MGRRRGEEEKRRRGEEEKRRREEEKRRRGEEERRRGGEEVGKSVGAVRWLSGALHGGVLVVRWWFLGDFLVVSTNASVVPRRYGISVLSRSCFPLGRRWPLGGLSVALGGGSWRWLRGLSVVSSWWYRGDALVLFRWCWWSLGGLLVMSCRHHAGVLLWCPSCVVCVY